MHEAPKLWHDHLEKELIKAKFQPSTEDPAVYYGRGMAIAVYVDDVLFFGPDADAMVTIINELQDSGFELKQEKDSDETAYSFLGIEISESNGFIKFTQHGLIKNFLHTVGMYDCNAKQTPCSTTPLGSNVDGCHHDDEDWEYTSAVGMLMYLAGNAHPKTAFAVHQCARYTHIPRQSHATAVKHLAKYFKGILNHDQGLMFKRTNFVSDLDLVI
jgi:Reverse transcriptase (RNA-dependent DNA polymerase)